MSVHGLGAIYPNNYKSIPNGMFSKMKVSSTESLTTCQNALPHFSVFSQESDKS